jgi:hypothetical protein
MEPWKTNIVIVSSHFHENLRWFENSKYQVVICTNHPTHTQTFANPLVTIDERCRAPANYGREVSSYIRFIVQYYELLPEYCVFLHGHETSWHQSYPGSLFEAIEHAKIDEYDYVNLNVHWFEDYLLRDTWKESEWNKVIEYWSILFENVLGEVPRKLKNYHTSAQFIVKRHQILKYSKAQWEFWLECLQNPDNPYIRGVWSGGRDFDRVAWYFEYLWHKLFGEEWDVEKVGYYESRFRPRTQ